MEKIFRQDFSPPSAISDCETTFRSGSLPNQEANHEVNPSIGHPISCLAISHPEIQREYRTDHLFQKSTYNT